jgi:Na+/melibiose symporter-like transporter
METKVTEETKPHLDCKQQFLSSHLPEVDLQAQDSKSEETATESRESTLASEPPFSVFTPGQKRWIAWMASFGAMFSTLNSYIYFPAVVPMARDLNVSVTMINLTITCYLIMAGIAPAFMGDLGDHDGRRPVYIIMIVLMVGSNVGLALQDSYPALFVLRMVQSAGSSGEYFPITTCPFAN